MRNGENLHRFHIRKDTATSPFLRSKKGFFPGKTTITGTRKRFFYVVKGRIKAMFHDMGHGGSRMNDSSKQAT
jgi:hypothetical protein